MGGDYPDYCKKVVVVYEGTITGGEVLVDHRKILGIALKTPTFAQCVPTSIENTALAYDAVNDRFKVDVQAMTIGTIDANITDKWARQVGQIDLARVLGSTLAHANPVIARLTSGTAFIDPRDRNWTISESLARSWKLDSSDVPDLLDRAGRLLGQVSGSIKIEDANVSANKLRLVKDNSIANALTDYGFPLFGIYASNGNAYWRPLSVTSSNDLYVEIAAPISIKDWNNPTRTLVIDASGQIGISNILNPHPVSLASIPNPSNLDIAISLLSRETTLGTVHDHVHSIDGKITACNTGAVTLTTDSTGIIKQATTPTIYNVTMTNANTEYSQPLPANTKKYLIHTQDESAFRLAFVTDKVATPTAPFLTIPASARHWEDNVLLASTTLYFASSSSGKIIEILAWV